MKHSANLLLKNKKLITFDATGTLFKMIGGVGQQYKETFTKHGIRHLLGTDETKPANMEKVIEENFRKSWVYMSKKYPCFGFPTRTSFDWWKELGTLTLEGAGYENKKEVTDKLFVELYNHFKTKEPWVLFPEVKDVLEELKKKGYVLGVVSNFDERLYPILDAFNIREYFVHNGNSLVVCSGEVGFEKPQQGVFMEALKRANISPDKTIHVGDDIEKDGIGPASLGISTFIIKRGVHPYMPFVEKNNIEQSQTTPYTTITSLSQLFDFIP
eukprot:TRINITY_DN3292_c0_g1_i1.p1 TRINITY_DN3292_c0_g1~~TRINITY_DN3292_c0_g1_i1.p1  ORF type:complete len:271 (-),score=48.60 TRINITY_DN3292_c0_g1_i1:135-947(-)